MRRRRILIAACLAAAGAVALTTAAASAPTERMATSEASASSDSSDASVSAASSEARATRIAHGTVYHDADHDGVHDVAERGLGGIVVAAGDRWTLTDGAGRWQLAVGPRQRIRVLTGWYRTQCDDVDCARGPGADQDFAVRFQSIQSRAGHGERTRLDVGLVPDWPGGYPVPTGARFAANGPDVAVRIKYVKPDGEPGASDCFRTGDIRHRACAPGDRPELLVEISHEGTTPLVDLAGHVELPPGIDFVSLAPSVSPPDHPALSTFEVGDLDPTTRRIPFAIGGVLPRAAVAHYTLVVEVTDAPITPWLQVKGEYPNAVGARVTSVWRDAESVRCTLESLDCPWGVGHRQLEPDNSDRVGFAVVPGPDASPPTTVEPTPSPPPPPGETDDGCTVDEILVPTCGVWLGASTPSSDGRYDYERGLAEYESVAQNPPDILHFYKRGAQRFPNASEIAMAERAGTQRALLLYNWKPSMTLTWAEVARGGADADIERVAASLRAYPHRLFLNIFHEPEDNVRPAAGSGMTTQDYVDMYRHVVDRLRSHGVDNAVFVWNPMGYVGWRDYLDGLYPGDAYVDWICYDPYAKNDRQGSLADIINTPRPAVGWPGFYDWATAKAPGKPLMLCEWGVDVRSNTDPASVLDGDIAAQLARFPQLKALVYWNDVDRVNSRIDVPNDRGRALGESYRRFAALPVFNAMTPDVAF